MKNILVTYHNFSGNGRSEIIARKIKKELELLDNNVTLFKSVSIESTENLFKKYYQEKLPLDVLVIMGGDGSFGIGVDLFIKAKLNIPICVYPMGTVNDFAKYLKIPKSPKKFAKFIMQGSIVESDVALANDNYVVNVACGGYFTHGVNTYSRKAKQFFGKFAYYGKNLFKVFNMKAHKLTVSIDGDTFTENLLFYLVLNSRSAGGFKKIGSEASINDGLFDFVGIKATKFSSLASLFFKIINGKHYMNKNLIYKQGKNFEITCDDNDVLFSGTDLDGNKGPKLPLKIKVLNKQILIYSNNKEQ